MIKQSFKFMLLVALLVVSGSLARADNYSIISSWTSGSAQFGDLKTFTGDGTFTWNGSAISNIVFSVVETSPTSGTIWTATSTDGELLSSNKELIIGDGASDCSGVDCVGITFASAITTGSALSLSGVSGFEFAQNYNFGSATLTDSTYASSVPEPSSVVLLLTVLAVVGFVVGKRRTRGASRAA